MNSKLRAILLPILRTVRSGKAPSFRNRSAAEQAIFLLGKPASQRRKKATAARKAKKVTEHQESTAEIRAVVFERANGTCEGCRNGLVHWGATMDHWSSGTGKSQRQTAWNCWALCGTPSIPQSCHYLRQRNWPDVALWNERFRKHCERYGYPFHPHIVHEPLTRKAT